MTSVPASGLMKKGVSQNDAAPPDYGNRPNIAEPYDVDYAEHGSTLTTPIPRLSPRQLNNRTQASQGKPFTPGYLTSTGTAYIHNERSDLGHSEFTSANTDTTDDEHRGRSQTGTRPEGNTLGRQRILNLEGYSSPRVVVGANSRSSQIYLEKSRTSSPDDHKRSTSSSTRRWLSRVPEEMEFPATSSDQPQHDTSSTSNSGQGEHRYYGSLGVVSRNVHEASGSAARYVEEPLGDEEDTSSISSGEEERILDEALATEGLYRGNYRRLLTLYTLVPLSTLLAFIILGLLPTLAYHNITKSPFPYPPYLPFPLPEIITATALWSLSYLLRDFLYATSLSGTSFMPFPSHRFPSFIPALTAVISAFLQSASSLFFRQLTIPILLVPQYSTEHLGLFLPPTADVSSLHKHRFPSWQDGAFRRVWWIALGWAAAEAIVGIKQGYESITLYKDVLVDVKDNPESEQVFLARATENHASGNNAHNNAETQRLFTPPLSSMSQVDSSITPTRRDWEDRTEALAVNNHKQGVPVTKSVASPGMRERQDSLSSFASLNNETGERQPLLRLTPLDQGLAPQSTSDTNRLEVENEVERDLDELMALKSREELEEVYGMPVIRIPVFISCLHRINSILSSLGICLLLTAAYMRSTLAYHSFPTDDNPSIFMTLIRPFTPSNYLLSLTIPPLLVLQTFLAMMHTPWILPRIGIHTFVYVELLSSLGLFFSGLGVWEALT